MAEDPFAHLRTTRGASWQSSTGDSRRGELDEDGWQVGGERSSCAYLAAATPWEQSGKSGTADDWEYARSHVADAIDRDGSFLDVGCASGYLMECLPRWTTQDVEPYGLDIAPRAGPLARRRLPAWADRRSG